MVFKWLTQDLNQCSILFIETDRCGEFFDAFSLDNTHRLRVPWSGGVVYVNLKIIVYFLYFLFRKSSFSRRMFMSAWVYAMSKVTKADKIVLYYLSAQPYFLSVAQLNHDIGIHCIYPYMVTDNKGVSIHRNIFHYVHDNTDVKRLIDRNIVRENITITGSPYLSLYKRCRQEQFIEKKFDVCLISQVVEELLVLPKSLYHEKGDRAYRRLLETLNTVYKENLFSGQLCVALRLSSSKIAIEKERRYFLDILTDVQVNFVENDPQLYSSYYAMEQSKVGLTLNSTVAFDMRHIGVESIFAIDEDIEFGPQTQDIKYYFPNGSPKGLLSVLRKALRYKNDIRPSVSVLGQTNKCNSIENISAILNRA